MQTKDQGHKLLAEYFFYEIYGTTYDSFQSHSVSKESMMTYAKILLACVNGDGEISELERDWVMGAFLARGCPKEWVQELEDLNPDINDLSLDSSWTMSDRLGILYNALKACDVDGTASGEREAIYKAAKVMDVPQEKVEQLEAIYQEEKELKSKLMEVIGKDWFHLVA